MPDASLRLVWRNTTQPSTVWDRPTYEEFFRAVRDLNQSNPSTRQVRVLLGDPPVDWDFMTFEEIANSERDQHPAELIAREVLARNRKALVVYGGMHLQRRNLTFNYDTAIPIAETLVSHLAKNERARVFSVWGSTKLARFQPDVGQWRVPSLAMLRGTVLGGQDFGAYQEQPHRLEFQNGRFVPIPKERWRSLPMEDQFDAVWYPGPSVTISRLSPALCADAEYLRMRQSRLAFLPSPPGVPTALERLCPEQFRK